MSSPKDAIQYKHVAERDKHSRTGVSQQTKKGGAGGKYTWGVAGISDLDILPIDSKDPNYVDDEESAVLKVDPVLEYKTECDKIIKEYLYSGDIGELTRALQELNKPNWLDEFVKRAIIAALEKHDGEREAVSTLLSSLYTTVIPHEKVAEGFRLVVYRLEDIVLDVPSAPDLVGKFIARAIHDDILVPAFLTSFEDEKTQLKTATLSKAKGLLEGRNAGEKLENVWHGEALHNPQKLKKSMRILLTDYLESDGNTADAEHTLRELNVPSFHFQFVKIAVVLAIEQENKEGSLQKLNNLLAIFMKSGLLSETQVTSGFKCCVDSICDISKDIPNARTLLLAFIHRAVTTGYLHPSFEEKAATETTNLIANERKQLENTKNLTNPKIETEKQTETAPKN